MVKKKVKIYDPMTDKVVSPSAGRAPMLSLQEQVVVDKLLKPGETVTDVYTVRSNSTHLTFGQALDALRAGHLVARRGWNGKGMWLVYVPGSRITTKPDTPYARALGTNYEVSIDPHIDMYTALATMQPGWLASQADMQATDWETVGGAAS